MLIKQSISLGDFYAFYTFLGAIVYPMLDIPHLLVASRQAFACVDRLEELRIDPTVQPANKFMSVDSVALKNISFQYPYKKLLCFFAHQIYIPQDITIRSGQ